MKRPHSLRAPCTGLPTQHMGKLGKKAAKRGLDLSHTLRHTMALLKFNHGYIQLPGDCLLLTAYCLAQTQKLTRAQHA